jgi:putative addiction module component (TIGR02574 family)
VEEIWDSIADDKIALSKENKKLLDGRLKTYHHTTKRTTWDAIKKNVRAKKAN